MNTYKDKTYKRNPDSKENSACNFPYKDAYKPCTVCWVEDTVLEVVTYTNPRVRGYSGRQEVQAERGMDYGAVRRDFLDEEWDMVVTFTRKKPPFVPGFFQVKRNNGEVSAQETAVWWAWDPNEGYTNPRYRRVDVTPAE